MFKCILYICSWLIKGDVVCQEEERRRYGSSVPTHLRHHQHHRGGQVIIDTEENLSDKEIYPNHMGIPAIGIFNTLKFVVAHGSNKPLSFKINFQNLIEK